ncbi:MAG: RNA pseudouridine synthase, partial [Fluviicola sp.]
SGSYKHFIENCFDLIDGQALHAKTLGFTHPVTKEWMQFDSELPNGFSELLNKWERYTDS